MGQLQNMRDFNKDYKWMMRLVETQDLFRPFDGRYEKNIFQCINIIKKKVEKIMILSNKQQMIIYIQSMAINILSIL